MSIVLVWISHLGLQISLNNVYVVGSSISLQRLGKCIGGFVVNMRIRRGPSISLPAIHQPIINHPSGTHQPPIRHSSDTHQTPIKRPSRTHPARCTSAGIAKQLYESILTYNKMYLDMYLHIEFAGVVDLDWNAKALLTVMFSKAYPVLHYTVLC